MIDRLKELRFGSMWEQMGAIVARQQGWGQFESAESVRLQEIAIMLTGSEMAKVLWREGLFKFGYERMAQVLPLISEPIGAGIRFAVGQLNDGTGNPAELDGLLEAMKATSFKWVNEQTVYSGDDSGKREVMRAFYLMGCAAGVTHARPHEDSLILRAVRLSCTTGALRDYGSTFFQVCNANLARCSKQDATRLAREAVARDFPGGLSWC